MKLEAKTYKVVNKLTLLTKNAQIKIVIWSVFNLTLIMKLHSPFCATSIFGRSNSFRIGVSALKRRNQSSKFAKSQKYELKTLQTGIPPHIYFSTQPIPKPI